MRLVVGLINKIREKLGYSETTTLDISRNNGRAKQIKKAEAREKIKKRPSKKTKTKIKKPTLCHRTTSK